MDEAKAEGAAAFKRGEFEVAASLFARAIDLGSPEPHLLHSNRSAALAAAGKYADSLTAAEAALSAGGESFVKGHYRRAVALAGLELWSDAALACARGLAQPEGAGHSQLTELQLKCAHEQRQQREVAPAWRTPEERRLAAAEAAKKLDADAAERRARLEAEREERQRADQSRLRCLDTELASQQQALKAEAIRRRREETEAAKHRACARVDAVKEDGRRPPESTNVSGIDDRAAAMTAHVKVESWRLKQMPTRQPLSAPRVPSDFTKQFSLLRKNPQGLFEYITLMQPADCVSIFKPEIPMEVLLACADAICQHVNTSMLGWCIEWLQALTQVGRFQMTILMLDKSGQSRLADMLRALRSVAEKSDAQTLGAIEKLESCFKN
ncbi:hypothetical protein AB1Y20_000985 [Prymnesium parvum]|uniref:RNA polymerase II-associated protein 3 n=1 Tax=Prymnesium parvum TaxID=97485 RepID=A0AB34K9Y0_PRYPA